MLSRYLTTLLLLGLAAVAVGQDSQGELTKVKEQELEEVRERISELKQSMDAAAEERDRLAALGQMAAGLAHEIRNPLGAIKGAAQLLKTSPPVAAEGGEAPGSEQDDGEPLGGHDVRDAPRRRSGLAPGR